MFGRYKKDLDLDKTDIYEVLSSERRRLSIEYLRDSEDLVDVNELADYIAEIESGESPAPEDIRKTVYVSLHQTHLPKMDELDIITYDEDSKEIELDESFKDIGIYLEVVPSREISWSELYLAIAVIGVTISTAYLVEIPFVSGIRLEFLTMFIFWVIAVAALYQTYTKRTL